MENKAIALIKSARDIAIKNREAAVSKAAQPFNNEIEAFDIALRKLGAGSYQAPQAKPIRKAAPTKKEAPKKAKTSAASAKTGKPSAAKPAPEKNAVAAKPNSGGYPKDGTILAKLTHVISEAKRFLSIQEVGERVKKYEPSQKVQVIKRRFSKHIDKFRKQGGVVSYTKDNKTYYGLPSYMTQGKVVKGTEHVSSAK